MILDSEEQRTVLLHALMSQPIQGDYQGIAQMLPKFTAVVDSVTAAGVKPVIDLNPATVEWLKSAGLEVPDGKPEQ